MPSRLLVKNGGDYHALHTILPEANVVIMESRAGDDVYEMADGTECSYVFLLDGRANDIAIAMEQCDGKVQVTPPWELSR